MQKATMSQIAKAAGVSQATVSFVLNGSRRTGGKISETTRQRVQRAARTLGYRPNHTARALVTGRSNLIGLCMWHLGDAYYSSVTKHAENQLRHSEYHLLVSCLLGQYAENDPQLLEKTFPWPLDGVLALEASTVLSTHWNEYHSWPVPIVSMGGMRYKMDNLDYVGVDLAVGVHQAISHLFDIGCRRIAFAAQRKYIKQTELRFSTYKKVMHEHRKKEEYISLDANSRDAGRENTRSYIAAHGCPDGILCFTDEVALGVYRALYDLKIKVPQQVALVGCDGIEDIKYLECPITTIVQPVEEMCRIARHVLEERIQDPQGPFHQKVLFPQLAVRESTSYFGGNVK